MPLILRQFGTIARLTAREAIRQPLAFLLFATVLLLIGLLPLILSHTLGETQKFVRDGALAFMWITGLLLGAHLACASLSNEVQRGTVSAVLSKPVQRTVFFLAKFAGIAFVMLLYCVGVCMAVLLAARTAQGAFAVDWWAAGPLWAALVLAFMVGGYLNFVSRRPFISSAFVALFLLLSGAFLFTGFVNGQGQLTTFGALYDFRILPVGALIALAILVLAGMSVALATRFRTITTLSICSGLFFIGLLSDYLFGRFAESAWWAALLYQLVPNWQHFWLVDALTGPERIPLSYIGWTSLYAGLYLAGVLLLGLVAMQRMEITSHE